MFLLPYPPPPLSVALCVCCHTMALARPAAGKVRLAIAAPTATINEAEGRRKREGQVARDAGGASDGSTNSGETSTLARSSHALMSFSTIKASTLGQSAANSFSNKKAESIDPMLSLCVFRVRIPDCDCSKKGSFTLVMLFWGTFALLLRKSSLGMSCLFYVTGPACRLERAASLTLLVLISMPSFRGSCTPAAGQPGLHRIMTKQ